MIEDMKNAAQVVSSDGNWAPYPVKKPLGENEVTITSLYLTMRDGVKIAVSYYLPVDLPPGEKRPTILRATRYWRALESIPPDERIRCFLANGYAWVGVDARGTGASFGCWSGTISPEELQDYGEIVDWIVAQPWSDGSVGTWGISYDGSTAEGAVTTCNPAIKAAMPAYAVFDLFLDFFPGGLVMEKTFQIWVDTCRGLDRNELMSIPLGKYKNLQVGVLAVDEDQDCSLLESAVQEHAYNVDLYHEVISMQYRDDVKPDDPSRTIKDFALYEQVEAFKRAGIPLYSYSGFGDIGYAMAAVHRFLNVRTPGSKLTLGPWNHGGSWNVSPAGQCPTAFNHVAEELRFFDQHLKGIKTGILQEAPVHYYTLVEEQWHAADTFPPPHRTMDLYFAPDGGLQAQIPVQVSAADAYQVDYSTGSGETSRWNPLAGGLTNYPDRAQVDEKLLCYTSAPLQEDLVITGIPLITLYLSASATNADVIVYLEDVNPEGMVQYITEGEIKTIHRKLSAETPPYNPAVPYHSFLRKDAMPLVPGEVTELVMHLLPVSYLVRKGHSLRVAIAGADADNFRIPNCPPPRMQYYRDADHPSHISLPVEIREAG